MKGRKEVGEDGRKGKKEEKFVENPKRNDLKARRNRVAEYYEWHKKHFTMWTWWKKIWWGNACYKKVFNLSLDKKNYSKHQFIQICVMDIYLNESKLIQFRKMTYVEFFPVRIEMSHVKSKIFLILTHIYVWHMNVSL